MENGHEQADPLLLEFLDLETSRDRIEFLLRHKEDLSEHTIGSMAASLDMVLDEDNELFDGYEQLLRGLRLHGRFETDRFR